MQSAEIFFGRKFKQEKLYRVVSQIVKSKTGNRKLLQENTEERVEVQSMPESALLFCYFPSSRHNDTVSLVLRL